MPEIDHLVLASPHLEEGVRHVEALTGARATAGGPHPGIGTRNALLRFDDATYLEVIAVDPDQPEPAQARPFGLDDGRPPRLAAFGVHPSPGESLEDLGDVLRSAGFDPGPVVALRRVTPEGRELQWRLTFRHGTAPPGDGVLPFVIDWGDTPSPATTAPPAGSLEVLRAQHPDPAVRAALQALALPRVEVAEGPPGLAAVVRSPRGPVVLS